MQALKIAGWINIVIAWLHLASLVRLRQFADWVNVGVQMDRLSAIHSLLPYLITVVTAAVFGIFGLYLLSAAGSFPHLPFVKPVVVAIAVLYLLRGVGGVAMNAFLQTVSLKEILFSAIALTIGIICMVGARSLLR